MRRKIQHVHHILAPHLKPWLRLGWRIFGYDRKPSVACDIVGIVWRGDGPPPIPKKDEDT